jgi:4-amino-4-deoxy-L-arabinose transferase-like glycosyltransferase
MSFISKYKNEILLGITLSLVYFLLRLVFLNRFPIFTDEAIYVRWAQIALQDASWRFISLTDGKQPMFVWAAMVLMKFIKDPLIAGRLVSVLTGFFTMIGLFVLSYELFKNKTTAFLTSTLYVFYPFAVVLDRMALYDSMVGAFYVWALYFSVLLVRKVRLDIAYTLGFIIGGGILTKTSNFFSIYLLPFLLILFNFKQKDLVKKLSKFILLAIFSAGIGYGLYGILRLSPLFQMISTKNATFIFPFSEWVSHPFTFFIGNLNGLVSWLLQYLTISYLILIAISVIMIKKFFKEKVLLLLYFVLPFVALALFGKVIYPRFIFFMSLMLLPLAGWGLNYLSVFIQKKINLSVDKIFYPVVITIIFILYPSFVSFQFVYSPINAPIANADRTQYLNGWSAGWGVKESIAFFEKQAKTRKIFIATEGTFGLLPEAMEMYLVQNKNITIKGYWPVDIFPKETLSYAKKMPSYFIFYQREHVVIPADFPLKLIFEVKQGNSDFYYRVYQIVPR